VANDHLREQEVGQAFRPLRSEGQPVGFSSQRKNKLTRNAWEAATRETDAHDGHYGPIRSWFEKVLARGFPGNSQAGDAKQYQREAR
jgi:hypothetical protein